MKSTRSLRNQMLRENAAIIGKLSARLTPIPIEELNAIPLPPDVPDLKRPVMAWRSRNYLVQVFIAATAEYPLMLRMSVNRAKVRPDGKWEDGLTWDELNAIKAELGYGDWYGIEIFPPTADIQNVANMRHLWLLETPLPIGF